jgi:putative acetyltransferase
MLVRAEQLHEEKCVERVHEAAFGGPSEASVVRAIRRSAWHQPDWSLVADDSGIVRGHVLFSYAGLEDSAGIVREIVVLAPLAVQPQCQRQGVGSALVRRGLELLDWQLEPMVVVRGNLAYYQRFGFHPSLEADVHAPFPVAEDHYLVKSLRAYQSHFRGVVRYPEAFRAVGYEAQWQVQRLERT